MARFIQLLILLVDVLNALLAFILLQLLGQRAVKPQGIKNKLIVVNGKMKSDSRKRRKVIVKMV